MLSVRVGGVVSTTFLIVIPEWNLYHVLSSDYPIDISVRPNSYALKRKPTVLKEMLDSKWLPVLQAPDDLLFSHQIVISPTHSPCTANELLRDATKELLSLLISCIATAIASIVKGLNVLRAPS